MERIKKYRFSFTQVPNALLTDKRVSAKAKGIYAYLLSKPDDWIFHTGVMLGELKERRDAFYSGLKELIVYGYIKKYQENANGCFGGCVYEFILPFTENPHTEKPTTENPHTNNIDLNNNNFKNNYLNKRALQRRNVDKSVDNGEKVLVSEDFKLDFEDEFFYPYRFAPPNLILSLERWIIKKFGGQELEKGFICRQIGNFAKKNGCFMDLLGEREENE